MKCIVIYGSRYGNTHEVAQAIGKGLQKWGSVELVPAGAAAALGDADLVIIGGPTEGHGMSEPLRQALAKLDASAMQGKLCAAFDTRMDWPRVLSGSAAARIVDRLRDMGAVVVGQEGSFLVRGKTPALEPGELERAAAWADDIGREASARLRVPATKL